MKLKGEVEGFNLGPLVVRVASRLTAHEVRARFSTSK